MKLIALSVLLFIASMYLPAKEIALTFDDAPRNDSEYLTGKERQKKLTEQLGKHSVEAMFFVVSGRISQSNESRLMAYQTSGHLLANHSDTHLNLRDTSIDEYITDISKAHDRLSNYQNFKRFFRYPYLNEGNTTQKRDAIRNYLMRESYNHGYVTVDNYDWYIDSLLQRAIKSKKKVNWEQLREIYITILFQSIKFYDDIATEFLGRSPKHVLLLHENDLAALYIGDLISLLKKNGWKIISPLEAYKDPMATQLPATLFNGQGRIAALAHVKGVKPNRLIHKHEDKTYLDKLFVDKKVFESLD